MLDNTSIPQLRDVIAHRHSATTPNVVLEASGTITLPTARAIASAFHEPTRHYALQIGEDHVAQHRHERQEWLFRKWIVLRDDPPGRIPTTRRARSSGNDGPPLTEMWRNFGRAR